MRGQQARNPYLRYTYSKGDDEPKYYHPRVGTARRDYLPPLYAVCDSCDRLRRVSINWTEEGKADYHLHCPTCHACMGITRGVALLERVGERAVLNYDWIKDHPEWWFMTDGGEYKYPGAARDARASAEAHRYKYCPNCQAKRE